MLEVEVVLDTQTQILRLALVVTSSYHRCLGGPPRSAGRRPGGGSKSIFCVSVLISSHQLFLVIRALMHRTTERPGAWREPQAQPLSNKSGSRSRRSSTPHLAADPAAAPHHIRPPIPPPLHTTSGRRSRRRSTPFHPRLYLEYNKFGMCCSRKRKFP